MTTRIGKVDLGTCGVLGVALLGMSLAGCSSSAGTDPTGSGPATVSKNGKDGCPVKSGFSGDDSCLPAPATAEGMQLHYGPSDYDDPADVARFTLAPGEEVDKCFFLKTPNTEDVYYSTIHGTLRPGSHHFIARAMQDRVEADGFADCQGADAPGTSDNIGGSQFREFTFPPPAPDYDGLAGLIPAGSQGMLNGHFINTTDKPSLSEGWLNYARIDPSSAGTLYASMSLNGGVGMRIEPGTRTTLHFSCSPTQAVRLLAVSGHFHAHTERFSAWKVSATGDRTLIMESFHWEELAAYNFDSVTQNTPSDRTALKDGAMSGPVTVAPDESVEWECDINNDSSATLKFRNEVQTGEMCMVVGTVAAAQGDSVPFTCTRN